MTPEREAYFAAEELVVAQHRARIIALEKKLEDTGPMEYPMSEFDADIAAERKRLNGELATLGKMPQ